MKFPVFSLLAGNFGLPETSSLLTASSSGESGANSSRREHYATLDQVGSRHLGKRPRDVANTTFPEAFPPINVSGPGPAEEEGCEISVPLTVVMPPRFRSSSWPNGSISTGPPARRSLRLRRAIAR
jgi:hypothetical protein